MNEVVLELINEQIWMENHSSCFYLNLAIEFGKDIINQNEYKISPGHKCIEI